jgi:Kdo2-lipid IVA lauroyltransferase/acyltransferase
MTVGRRLKAAASALVGRMFVLLIKLVRRLDRRRTANLCAWVTRTFGPWLKEHRLGRENLAAAFPEKSAAEIEEILLGVWENLGRAGAEYAHLDRLWDYEPERVTPGRIEFAPGTIEQFFQLRDDGKPALVFAAHLANWELPALAAAVHGLDNAVVYRMPNVGRVAIAVRDIRAVSMGELIPTGLGAPSAIAAALERGKHVGILVDQHFTRGVDVVFFGRRCKANPMIGRLARHYDCPIHGTRAVRLPGNRFRIELTKAVVPPRDSEGQVDIQATMQAITSIVEGWVREHPEQWLWLHRRWR